MIVYSPFVYMDPLSTNLTHMFCQLFQDALTEYTYAAELAGLGYNIQSTIYGLVVCLFLCIFYITSDTVAIMIVIIFLRASGIAFIVTTHALAIA